MIQVKNLSKSYQSTKALNDVSLTAAGGEFIALLGGSGSGKTTLLKCLGLRERWDKGSYVYDGINVFTANPLKRFRLRKQFAYLGESPILNPNRTALGNVLTGRFAHMPVWRAVTRIIASDEYIIAGDYLEKLGLLDKAKVKAGQLSGGEQQRVALARALVKGAKVLFVDVPVSGLEPAAVQRIMEDMLQLCKKEGTTVFCALNQPELAEQHATRIIGLSAGQIVVDIRGRKLTLAEKRLLS